jgi:sugar phosphate isomerase/epimerase
MSDRDDGDDPQPKRLIYEMRRRVQMARNRYWDEGVEGRTSPETKKSLAKAAVKYWDVLYEFRSETVLDDEDFPDMTEITSRLGQQTAVWVESAGRKRGSVRKQQPAIAELDAEYLLELTEELDDLAKRLGFGATAREATPHNEIGHDDLAALLEARGQDEAREKIPGGE